MSTNKNQPILNPEILKKLLDMAQQSISGSPVSGQTINDPGISQYLNKNLKGETTTKGPDGKVTTKKDYYDDTALIASLHGKKPMMPTQQMPGAQQQIPQAQPAAMGDLLAKGGQGFSIGDWFKSPTAPTLSGMSNTASNFLGQNIQNPAEWSKLLADMAQMVVAGYPQSGAYQAAGMVGQRAKNQLFAQAMENLMGGQQTPFGNSPTAGLAAAGLGPEEQQALFQSGMAIHEQPINDMYKMAIAGGVETPKDRLFRELATMSQPQPSYHSELINEDPQGNKTDALHPWQWFVDNQGNKVRPIGPVIKKADEPGAGAGSERVKWMSVYNAIRADANRKFAQFGKIQTDNQGNTTIVFDNPQDQAKYEGYMAEKLGKQVELGNFQESFIDPMYKAGVQTKQLKDGSVIIQYADGSADYLYEAPKAKK